MRASFFRALRRILCGSVAIAIGGPASTVGATWNLVGPAVPVDSVSADQEDPRIVYVSRTGSGVWKTIDGGLTWALASSGLPAGEQLDLAVDPTNSFIVYAATSLYGAGSGVFKTVNGGATWFPARTGLPGGDAKGIAVSRSSPTDLLVTVGTTLYRSHNGALTWEPVGAGLPADFIVAVFSPTSSSIILAAVPGPSAGLFRSIDGGSTWSRLSSFPIANGSLKFVGPVAFDPRNASVVYASSTGCGLSCYGSLWKSTDGGASWSYANLSTGYRTLVVVDASSAITVSTISTVFRSTDGGLGWSEFDDGLGGGSFDLEASVDRLYAANGGVFFASIPAAPGSPSITQITPSSGPAAGGTSIGVDGTGFQSGAAFKIGAVPTAGSVTGPTHVDALTPVLSPGRLNDVVIVNPDRLSAYLPDSFFADFLDVDQAHPFHSFVETLARRRVTAGCGSGGYCPGDPVTRAQVSVLLLRSKESPYYLPPSCVSPVFSDVPCSSAFAPWVDELAARGVTAGCAAGLYCPTLPITRAQIAVMLLRTREGASYVPPTATGIFSDVPPSSAYAPFVEELARRGITAGCGGGRYCPDSNVTRGQMAVFLTATFFAS